MAAAEYYNPSGGSATGAPVPPRQYPVQAPHPSQQHLNPPYPISDAPPPYTEYAPSSGPSQQQPQRPNDGYNRPPPPPQQSSSYSSSQYPPEKPSSASSRPIATNSNSGYHNNNQYPTQFVPGSYPSQPSSSRPGPPPSKSGYLQPPNSAPDPYRRPASTPAPPKGILKNKHEQSPYRHRSRSRSRSSSRERPSRHRHHSHQQQVSSQHRPMDKKPNSSLKTFLGAGGGAIIGDAIFPGLGTLGGAIIGGLSGHEYGKRRDADDRNTRYVLADNKTRSRSYSNNDDEAYGYYRDERRGRRH